MHCREREWGQGGVHKCTGANNNHAPALVHVIDKDIGQAQNLNRSEISPRLDCKSRIRQREAHELPCEDSKGKLSTQSLSDVNAQ